MPPTHRRPREIDPAPHCCPHAGGHDRGWLGLGHLRAHGPPSGGPWRPCHCPSCKGSFLETHGTLCHGPQAAGERIVRGLAGRAAGLGIRATARGGAVAPTTVWHWLGAAAEPLRAFSASFLWDLPLEPRPLDAGSAVLRALHAGALSEDEAITRLERSPAWVWTAMDPRSKVLVVVEGGSRPLAMAQRVVPQGPQRLAPGGVPRGRTDGLTDYATALLAHVGQWLHPARRQPKGPTPTPRWLPLPALRYAQVVTSSRRRRRVGGTHRVGVGTPLALEQVLAACGWPLNPACIARLHLDIRQRVAAGGRRVTTLCRGAEGLREQLVVGQTYHPFGGPHASWRQPLSAAEAPHGGSAKGWRPWTPAMAAGLTDHVWSLTEVLVSRVPPWPQPQTV
jgi:hypothetical protein